MTNQPKRPEHIERGDWLPGSRAGSWFFSKVMPPLDRLIFRLSGERKLALPAISGLNTIVVTARGAKSGLPRTFPVVATALENQWIIVASNWGRRHNPGWYYNLRANPEVTINAGGRIIAATARELSGAEREQYWQVAVGYYKVYQVYTDRSGRELPVFLLEPK